MRYLLLGLAFALAGCAVVFTWNTHNRVAAALKDCEGRGLTERPPTGNSEILCVAEITVGRCNNDYLSGKLGGYEDWFHCLGPDQNAYCTAYMESEKLADLCIDIFSEIAVANDPISKLMLEDSDTVMKQCRSRHESKELLTWVAKARCLNDGYDGVMRRYQVFLNRGGYLRLARKRLEVAEHLDAGTITVSEVDQNWEHYRESCWALPVSSKCEVR